MRKRSLAGLDRVPISRVDVARGGGDTEELGADPLVDVAVHVDLDQIQGLGVDGLGRRAGPVGVRCVGVHGWVPLARGAPHVGVRHRMDSVSYDHEERPTLPLLKGA